MKTGIMITAYTGKYSFEDSLARMKAHGFDALDYQDFMHTENKIFHVDEAAFAATLKREREIIEANGLTVSQAHGPWRGPVQDASDYDRAERFAAMAKGIRGAALLGAPRYVIHCMMPFGENNPEHRDELWEINAEYYGRLCKVAEDCGVVICLENLPFTHLPLSRACDVLEFVRMMNNPAMKMCLDTGHAAIYGDPMGDVVRMIGKEYLGALHVHDNDGRGDLHWRPGEGIIDWADFTKALHEIGFEGTVSLETGPAWGDDPALWDEKGRVLGATARAIANGTYGK